MNFCPNCGTELLDPNAEFCPSCGNSLFSKQAVKKRPRKQPRKKTKKAKQQKNDPLPEVMGEPVDDGYDGYYDDVLPPDLDRVSEGIDTDLIRQIALLLLGAIMVIGGCIAMMYLL